MRTEHPMRGAYEVLFEAYTRALRPLFLDGSPEQRAAIATGLDDILDQSKHSGTAQAERARTRFGRLRAWDKRVAEGLSRNQLAEQLGIHPSTITRYENGNGSPLCGSEQGSRYLSWYRHRQK